MDNKNSNVNGGGKDAALFGNAAGANYVGGTGEAPNADLAKPVDNTDELQAIAEGADPEAVKRAAEEKEARKNRYNPQQFENMRSQSVVYSQREITEQQLAEVRARNEAAVREAKLREAQEKAKRTSVKIGLIIFIVIIVVAVGWLLIVILSHTDPVVPPTPEPEPEKPVELSKVDGYSCETTVCGKIVDLPDGRIVLRDTAYYIYNTSTKERLSTTIDQQDYNSVKPFIWNSCKCEFFKVASFCINNFCLISNYFFNTAQKSDFIISRTVNRIISKIEYICSWTENSYFFHSLF